MTSALLEISSTFLVQQNELTEVKERLNKAERIIKLAELTRKFETEREKVLPFYESSVEDEEKAATDAADMRKSLQSSATGKDGQTVEEFTDVQSFDAVVCSLVLCSVHDPEQVVRQLYSLLRPGGELRYLEHVAEGGGRGRLQKFVDATFWPRLLGNCHTHRHTESTIAAAGLQVTGAHRERVMPAWVPMPAAEFAMGVAVRPD